MRRKMLYIADRPITVSVTLTFLLHNVLVWLAFGVIIAVDVHPVLPNQIPIKGVMAILSLATAGILLEVCIFRGKCSRIAYFIKH